MLNAKLDFEISKECSVGVSAPGFEGADCKSFNFFDPNLFDLVLVLRIEIDRPCQDPIFGLSLTLSVRLMLST